MWLEVLVLKYSAGSAHLFRDYSELPVGAFSAGWEGPWTHSLVNFLTPKKRLDLRRVERIRRILAKCPILLM